MGFFEGDEVPYVRKGPDGAVIERGTMRLMTAEEIAAHRNLSPIGSRRRPAPEPPGCHRGTLAHGLPRTAHHHRPVSVSATRAQCG
jgi:hypothetical protein